MTFTTLFQLLLLLPTCYASEGDVHIKWIPRSLANTTTLPPQTRVLPAASTITPAPIAQPRWGNQIIPENTCTYQSVNVAVWDHCSM